MTVKFTLSIYRGPKLKANVGVLISVLKNTRPLSLTIARSYSMFNNNPI